MGGTEAEYVPTPASGSNAVGVAAVPSASVSGQPPEVPQVISDDSQGDDANLQVVPVGSSAGVDNQLLTIQDSDRQRELATLREELVREVSGICNVEIVRAALANVRELTRTAVRALPAYAAAGLVPLAAAPAVPEVVAAVESVPSAQRSADVGSWRNGQHRARRYSDAQRAAATPLRRKLMELADFNANVDGGVDEFGRLISEAKAFAQSAEQKRCIDEAARCFSVNAPCAHSSRIDEMLEMLLSSPAAGGG